MFFPSTFHRQPHTSRSLLSLILSSSLKLTFIVFPQHISDLESYSEPMVIVWNCLDYVTTVISLTSDLKGGEMNFFLRPAEATHSQGGNLGQLAGAVCLSLQGTLQETSKLRQLNLRHKKEVTNVYMKDSENRPIWLHVVLQSSKCSTLQIIYSNCGCVYMLL